MVNRVSVALIIVAVNILQKNFPARFLHAKLAAMFLWVKLNEG